MKWKKLGLVFASAENYPWMVSHAALPIAEHLERDLFRIYFSCRDRQRRSHVGSVEIDLKRPTTIRRISERPLLCPGAPGTFDDSGAMPSWIIPHENKRYLFYIGWNLGITVPFRNSTGLAVSAGEDDPFKRVSDGPVLDRNLIDAYFCTNPCVIADNGAWRMWYLSCVGWETVNERLRHRYHIKYAESADLLHWDRKGLVSIDFKSPDEYAISRPCVLKDQGGYKMWYSYRGKAYGIGYAESADGLRWIRKDEEAGIYPSENGWDSKMIEYAYVFDHGGTRYMLYNGNEYGKTGFGLATLAG